MAHDPSSASRPIITRCRYITEWYHGDAILSDVLANPISYSLLPTPYSPLSNMPTVPFESLSDAARVWVFASEKPLPDAPARQLLGEVDRYLEGWKAHGSPLTCAREWRDDRFLAIGVEGGEASGCSIDGLFRKLTELEPTIGTSLSGGDRIFYRDSNGRVNGVSRDQFNSLVAKGSVGAETRVFDTSLTTLEEYRDRFETSAKNSWHRKLLRGKAD